MILAILIVRAVTLDGAGDGLRLFFVPDFSTWANPQLWLAAFSQVFFSLSLAFGIMIAYGSLKQKGTDITKGALYIAGGNFLVSLMSGIVVFGTLGYMALQQGVPVSDVVAGGPALPFVVFPAAINLLPAMNALIAVLFFGMFFALALDSAFSLLEALAISVKDRFPKTPTSKIAFILMIVGVIGGLLFSTQGGLYMLDILDHFIVNYGLIIVGILEATIVGWIWKGNDLKEFVNKNSDVKFGFWWDASIKFIIPIFLTVLLILNIKEELSAPYEGYPESALFYVGVLPLLLTPLIAYGLDRLTSKK